MRAYILALCFACLSAMPAAAMSSSSGLVPNDGLQTVEYRSYSRYDRDYGRRHWGYGADCRELRRACLFKEDLGEVGRGNCQRYRSLCR